MVSRLAEFRALVEEERRRTGRPATEHDLMRPAAPRRGLFIEQAASLAERVHNLRRLLMGQRREYLNFIGAGASTSTTRALTDPQRDELEMTVAGLAQKLRADVVELEGLVDGGEAEPDARAHRHAVVRSLEFRIGELGDEMKALMQARLAHVRRKQALAQAASQRTQRAPGAPASRAPEALTLSKLLEEEARASGGRPAATSVPEPEPEPEPVSRQLEMENELLLRDLQDELDEAHQAERSVVEISKLFDVFSTEVARQSEVIGSIADDVANAEVNIKLGNRELEKAEKDGVSFRILVLFVIVMTALSLLFLDAVYD